jgi:hypothetical protein
MSDLKQIVVLLEQALNEARRALRALDARSPDVSDVVDKQLATTPSDFIRQTQAVSKFGVSRSFLYDLGKEQIELGATWVMRLENGHLRYSQSGLERHLKANPVRGSRRYR